MATSPTTGAIGRRRRFERANAKHTAVLTCPLGTALKVTRITDQDPAFLRFIESNGLKPGEQVEVESRDDAADAVVLRHKDRRITIGARAGSKLLVEVVHA